MALDLLGGTAEQALQKDTVIAAPATSAAPKKVSGSNGSHKTGVTLTALVRGRRYAHETIIKR